MSKSPAAEDPLQDSYSTIQASVQTELRIERSRFVGTAVGVSSRIEAEHVYADLKRKYHDATHNCFAYRVGLDPHAESRFSDDGEPGGTAGRPIFDAIESAGVTNLLIVVTRYYGGVKLGTGGLARAYRDSATATLAAATIVEKLIYQHFIISFEHDDTSIAMKVLSDLQIRPEKTDYAEKVTITARIRLSLFEQFRATMMDRSRGRVLVEAIAGAESEK